MSLAIKTLYQHCLPFRQPFPLAESKTLFNHHINSIDDFLRPIVRSYYSSPQLTLLLTFLHLDWEDIVYPVGVDATPYLSSAAESFEYDQGLRLASWFLRCRYENWDDDGKFFGNYGKFILDFLEDSNRSGELALDEGRFATAALCCLQYLCGHGRERFPQNHGTRIRRNSPWTWRKISVWDANITKRETRHLHHIIHKLGDTAPLFEEQHARVPSWSMFYLRGLEHLPFLLERSGYSEELTRYLHRRPMFAVGCLEYRNEMKRARVAIAKYLSTFRTRKSI